MICAVVRASVTPPRASPLFEMPSLPATIDLGCGPFLRSSANHSGGDSRSSFNSERVTGVDWKSSGAAGKKIPSFCAAVAGFIVCSLIRTA